MRLKGEKKIESIFKEGKSVFVFPIKAVFLSLPIAGDCAHFSYGVSVSKRNFKRAVDRNRIKRQLREIIFKQEKNIIENGLDTSIMYIYVGKELLEFSIMETAIHKINRKLLLLK